MPNRKTRFETDSMGTVEVPQDALFGAQTQRAVNNFTISRLTMPAAILDAIIAIKDAAARVNTNCGVLSREISNAILDAIESIPGDDYHRHFPVDIFQTGSGTSTNMNVNEVIATLACYHSGLEVRANDHVNMSQSSNDVIPTSIRIAAACETRRHLLVALAKLRDTIDDKRQQCGDITKTGRTHLMDAMPITVSQEMSAWSAQVSLAIGRFECVLPQLEALPIGGTAIGTRINTPDGYIEGMVETLGRRLDMQFSPVSNYFEAISTQDVAVELSGHLRSCVISLMKIANDLRWMNSGPLTGLGEIELEALQPGSSIMPGKVNPVIPEAVIMAAAQVIGNDQTIATGGQGGNFQLNTMLPVIAYNLMQSIELTGNSAIALADKAIAGFTIAEAHINENVNRNPILVTVLNPVIGYQKAAEIAKIAYRENRPILDVAEEVTDMSRQELEKLLDPKRLTKS
ncbi:MAG: fumarate hydratase class II [marine bacterium B5-7]|nr:MAG: fumarate hydratase class II [marine bacterium B5-7]